MRWRHAIAQHGKARTRAYGHSLVELLVSTGLGLVVLAGVLATLHACWQSHRRSGEHLRLQERALHVLGVLEPSIQLAGYFGLAPATRVSFADAATPRTVTCGAGAFVVLGNAIQAFPSAPFSSCFLQGGGPQPLSHVLLVRRASTHIAMPQPGRLQVLTQSMPVNLGWITSAGAATTQWVRSHQELRDLVMQVFYIARQADGEVATPALRVKTLTRIGSSMGFLDTEVMPGISDFTVTPLAAGAGHSPIVRVQFTVHAERSQLHVDRTFKVRNGQSA